jgi:hypothetical protein
MKTKTPTLHELQLHVRSRGNYAYFDGAKWVDTGLSDYSEAREHLRLATEPPVNKAKAVETLKVLRLCPNKKFIEATTSDGVKVHARLARAADARRVQPKMQVRGVLGDNGVYMLDIIKS